MMYQGGAGWLGWIAMGLSMLALVAIVVVLFLAAARSFGQNSDVESPSPGALSILKERLARGEISQEEYTEQSHLIRGSE